MSNRRPSGATRPEFLTPRPQRQPSNSPYVSTSSDRGRELRQYGHPNPQQPVDTSSRRGWGDTLAPRRHEQPDFQYGVGTSSRPSNGPNNDIIIAVMGPTGAGKSTLINNVLGTKQSQVGHSLASCTQDVQSFDCFDLRGNHIVLIDTPGFNDTNVSDFDVLQLIANWLKESYKEHKLLSGLLFLHRISDNRMAGSPLLLLDTFKSICGKDAFQNVVLVTTMWDHVDYDVGEARERELLTSDQYWKPMINGGSRTVRSNNTPESARSIISRFNPEFARSVLLQRELVDQGKALPETTAGRSFIRWLAGVIQVMWEALQSVLDRLQRAKQPDPTLQADIDHQKRVLKGASSMILTYTSRSSGAMPEVPYPSSIESRTSYSASEYSRRSSLGDFSNPPTAMEVIQLVGSSPNPDLTALVVSTVKITDLIEKINCTDDSLVLLHQNTWSMTHNIIVFARSGISEPMKVVNMFVNELSQIRLILEHVLERRRPHKSYLSDRDQKAVKECNKRIQSAYQGIIMPSLTGSS